MGKLKLENFFHPMLCETGSKSDLNRRNYVAELKVDGSHGIIERTMEDGFRIFGRRGLPYNDNLPDLTEEFIKIPIFFRLVGEIVYIDRHGHMIFAGAQKRCQIRNSKKVEEYRNKFPVGIFVWDIPMLNSVDLTKIPYYIRRQILEKFYNIITEKLGITRVRLVPISKNPQQMYEQAINNGYEGIVMKEINSPYLPDKRTRYWLKVKGREHTVWVL